MAKKRSNKEERPSENEIAVSLYQWGAAANGLSETEGNLALEAMRRFYALTGVAQNYPEIAILLGRAEKDVRTGYIGDPVIAEAVEMYAKKFNDFYMKLTCAEALNWANNLNGLPLTENILNAFEAYRGTKVGELKEGKLSEVVEKLKQAVLTLQVPHTLRVGKAVGDLEELVAPSDASGDKKD